MGTLLAGTRYCGDFEERIKEVIKELEASRRLLLIHEIHTVIGAGATSGGSMDASARPTYADPLYQHVSFGAVESGEPPRLFGVEPPKPRIEAVRPTRGLFVATAVFPWFGLQCKLDQTTNCLGSAE